MRFPTKQPHSNTKKHTCSFKEGSSGSLRTSKCKEKESEEVHHTINLSMWACKSNFETFFSSYNPNVPIVDAMKLLIVFFYVQNFILICVFMCVCLCAEVKRHRVYSAAHPVANTQSRSRASEDQSCCEKGRQFNTVTYTPWSYSFM